MRVILLVSLIFVLLACATKKAQDGSSQNTVDFDAPFKITQKKGVQFENDDLKLSFDAITEDSRCPEGATCVWEGQAKAALTVTTKSGSEKIVMVRKGGQKENSVAEVGHYRIYLAAVNPYPKEGATIEPADYKLSLIVKQK